jgi:hypothetical protein
MRTRPPSTRRMSALMQRLHVCQDAAEQRRLVQEAQRIFRVADAFKRAACRRSATNATEGGGA